MTMNAGVVQFPVKDAQPMAHCSPENAPEKFTVPELERLADLLVGTASVRKIILRIAAQLRTQP